jgi:hypothetical protein
MKLTTLLVTLLSSLLPFGLAVLAGGCVSEGDPKADQAAAETVYAPAPWTTRYASKGVVMAREIVVEGPEGLREHAALQQNDTVATIVVDTTAVGLVQQLTKRDTLDGQFVELRGHVDNWNLVAFERITLIERPDRNGPVRVIAMGEAYVSTDGEERRGERLEVVGESGR